MTIYINYHFVRVTKWNLNIIKKHTTFKQHLRMTQNCHTESHVHVLKSTEVSQTYCSERFSIHFNVNQRETYKRLPGVVTAEWGEIHADWSAYQSTTHCWSLTKPCLLVDSPDNHYNWDTCTYSDVVDSTNCRGHIQLKSGQNKWQLGMAVSLYLSGYRSCLKSKFCYTLSGALLDSVVGFKKKKKLLYSNLSTEYQRKM